MIVLLLQLDQDVVGICGVFSSTMIYDRLSKVLVCMVSQASYFTWPIAIEFLRAVFSPFRVLKEYLLAIATGIYNLEKRHSMLEWIFKKNISMRNEIEGQKIIYSRILIKSSHPYFAKVRTLSGRGLYQD